MWKIQIPISLIKQYPVLSTVYEKTLESYCGLLMLALSIIVFNRIEKEKTIETDEQIEKKRIRKENDKERKKIVYDKMKKKKKDRIEKEIKIKRKKMKNKCSEKLIRK